MLRLIAGETSYDNEEKNKDGRLPARENSLANKSKLRTAIHALDIRLDRVFSMTRGSVVREVTYIYRRMNGKMFNTYNKGYSISNCFL